MKKLNQHFLLLTALILLAFTLQSKAIEPAKIFCDNMVVQQGINFPVWGTAAPGEKINVEMAGLTTLAQTDKNGKWMARFPIMQAGGPFEMKISGSETMTYKNVMVGEVWLASGQSNMEWKLGSGVINTDVEIAAANFPMIRYFEVEKNVSRTPVDELENGKWTVCTPETAKDISAVAYYFARDLFQQQNVAVGIIQSFWGGTVCEAWTSQEMLATLNDFAGPVKEIQASDADWTALQNKANKLAEKRDEIEKTAKLGIEKGAYKTDYNESGWQKTQYPISMWNEGVSFYWGFIWLRKWVDIPAEMVGKPLTMNFGKVAFEDITWFNGVEIGSETYEDKPREYEIPGNLVKAGKNLITVRVLSRWGAGKLGTESGVPELKSADSNQTISLKGEWLYNIKIEPEFPLGEEFQNKPSALYNAMISPVLPYGIKGAIWYQGESNADRGYQYRELFPAMITDWRVRWGQGYFPFLFVQLANYEKRNAEPVDNNWAELREAQSLTLKLPNTGMAVIIDVGDAEDIHPRNKKPVGERLYLAARKVAYNESVVSQGPVYDSFEIVGDEIQLNFIPCKAGLKAKDNHPLKGFSIAGADKKFVWADAKIEGDKVVVSSPKIKNPVAVRYGWDINPECTLFNTEGLPASPFRTDDWDGLSKGKK